MSTEEKPVIHTAATAHLDTIWNWDFETTVGMFIKDTLDKNFRLFEKYPDYIFSFEGSRRYELMEEYYPIRFKRLKKYIENGRWHVTGSAYENGDVNVPSPEAMIRNILFGQDYFEKTFGKKSVDIYLPDCFGFGHALPTVMKHCGLLGFTTQKLTWSSAYGIPFDLGYWQGVDGSKVFASLNALSYNQKLEEVRKNEKIANKLNSNMVSYDLPMTYVLHGTGDKGGSPTDGSVETTVREKNRNTLEDVEVTIDSIDNIFRVMDKLPEESKQKLPVWNNELVSTDHGVGGYTSRAIGKRWNKRNEQLADAAERTAVAASFFGAAKYPEEVLNTAWKRVIAHQFHDDLPGTSVQRAYKRSWNEYALSLNQFASVYESSFAAVAGMITTPKTKGIAVAVSNTTDTRVKDFVECKLPLPEKTEYVKVKAPNGSEVPSQISGGNVIFTADVPGNGWAVYTVLPATKPYSKKTGLSADEKRIENKKYAVTLDDNGDIASVIDKEINKELLTQPVSMDIFSYNGSKVWPAWELDYPEVMSAPEGKASEPSFTLLENGAARAVIKTVRHYGDSEFIQKIILGESSSVLKIENEIEWRCKKKLLKTPFALTVSEDKASYDLGLGVIKRGINTPKLYEVPAQNWADISSEEYGVSILSDCKYGWDHPFCNTLRLTGIHTPGGDFRDDSKQSLMDLGKNRYAFGIFSHKGSDLTATQQAGTVFSRPLCAFAIKAGNNGALPSEYSFASLSDEGVIIKAIKKELNGRRIIVRVAETAGKEHKNIALRLGEGIISAAEVTGTEQPIKDAEVKDGKLIFDITPYSPKTFAVVLKPFGVSAPKLSQTDIPLDYNLHVTSPDQKRHAGAVGGYTLPTELFPKKVVCKNAVFTLSEGKKNALACDGGSITLPEGTKSVALLITSVGGDKNVGFICDGKKHTVYVPDCFENIGAWDLYGLKEKGYMKPCTLAYEITHTHKENENAIAKQCWMFRVDIPCEKELILPNDKDILIFSAAAFDGEQPGGALHPLYDELSLEPFDYREEK